MLQVRAVSRADLENLSAGFSRIEGWSIALNGVFVVVVVALLREPLDPRAYHTIAVCAALAFVYGKSFHQEAKMAALQQIKKLLLQFVEIENELYKREQSAE